MRKFISDLFTESDNKTWDLIRIIAGLLSVSVVGFTVLSLLKGNAFDMMNFGTGTGALLGGIGAALGFKKDTPIS